MAAVGVYLLVMPLVSLAVGLAAIRRSGRRPALAAARLNAVSWTQ